MKKRIGILLGVILAISALVAIFIIADGHNHTRIFSFQDTARLAEAVNYDDYEPNSIIPADKNSGDIAEKIEGDKDAPIIIYEYADYACSHCAEANAVVNKMLKDYDGKIALVFRGYLISYFRNNVIASSAATAAQLQGYWEEYKNLLFENQATWYYQSGTKLRDYLGELFTEASNGQGDLDKFYQDLSSDNVAKRVAFEYGIGSKVDISGTPTFYINGEAVSASQLKETVEKLLK